MSSVEPKGDIFYYLLKGTYLKELYRVHSIPKVLAYMCIDKVVYR